MNEPPEVPAPPADASAPPATSGQITRPPAWHRRSRVRWTVRLLVLAAVCGYLKFVGLDGCFYYPDQVVYVTPAELRLRCENVTFPTSDGLMLHGWFLPAVGEPRGLVVHFHGNAANISNHLPLVHWLPAAGYHVLMFDYRGYGQSPGRPTRAGTVLDGQAAVDYALSRPEVRDLPLFVYGQSLGGAVAIVVAADRPEIRAVVAETTFGSYRGIAARHARKIFQFDWLSRLVASMCISSGYDPIDVVQRISPRPLLVITAGNDQICFPELGRELYAAASEPKTFWEAPGAEHLDIISACQAQLVEQITDFFKAAASVEH